MSTFEKFVGFLQTKMDTPKSFGTFHLIFLAFIVLSAIFFVWCFRNASDKTIRILFFVFWIVLVVLEIYKQFIFSITAENGIVSWDYQWHAFPFQFCSTPLYALPFIIFLKNGRMRNAFMAFFASFSFFAGLAVVIYPNDVFTSMAGINYQTMIHHGSQVVLGALIVAYNRRKMSKRYFVGSLIVFYFFAGIAMIINEVVHNHFVATGSSEQINMFFISPYYDCTLPVLSIIHDKVPYPAFLCVYLIGFALVSGIIFTLEKLILRVFCGKQK